MTLENETPPTEETQSQETPDAAPAEPAQDAAPAETETKADDQAAPAEDAKPEGAHKRKGGWQRQVEKLQRERDALLERLAAQSPGQQPPPQPDKEQTPEDKVNAYVEQLVERQLAAREAQREQAARMAEFARRTQEVRATHPDFDEVVASVDVPVSHAVQEALLTSEHGPAIMYELAANPAELVRISALPPLAAAREIGRLEARASSTATPKATPRTAAPRKPAAPAPIAPVTARGPTTVKRPEEMTYEEYNAWRDSQRKR